jgi:hypothetical protein
VSDIALREEGGSIEDHDIGAVTGLCNGATHTVGAEELSGP